VKIQGGADFKVLAGSDDPVTTGRDEDLAKASQGGIAGSDGASPSTARAFLRIA
jgi:hypothetical protein